jgi:hypothetical protein
MGGIHSLAGVLELACGEGGLHEIELVSAELGN